MRNWKLTTIPPTRVGGKNATLQLCCFLQQNLLLFPTPERPLFYLFVEERWWPAWFDPCSIWNGNSLRCHPEAPHSPLFAPPLVWLWLWKKVQWSVRSCACCREGCGRGIPRAKSSPVHTQLVYFIFVEQFFPLNSFLALCLQRGRHTGKLFWFCAYAWMHTPTYKAFYFHSLYKRLRLVSCKVKTGQSNKFQLFMLCGIIFITILSE